MPYKKFTEVVQGIKMFGLKNISTGKITLYSTKKRRDIGIKMKEAFAHGWTPTRRARR